MFTRIQRLLDVRPALDLRELVTIFGCVQLQSAVEQLLRAYKARFLASLPAEERARADLTRPAFLAAAFLLAAKKRKAKVDRAALTTKMGLTRGELDGALKDVAARCADMLQPPQQLGEGGEGAGRKRGRGDVAGAEQEAADEPAEAPRAAGGRGGAAKRPRRGAAARGEPEVEEDEAVAAAAANDVAVEDLRLVLCGIRPAQAPAAAGDEDEGADVPAERLKDRKKSKKAKKGSRAECGDGGDEGAALADEEEVAEVVAVAAAVAKKGKSKKSRRPQGGEQDEGRGEVEGLVAGGV
ncbi:hypothetical protein HXX76_010232 [Chlamydomonas incerta]|uniref:ORC6 second cyclin-like domain-containing protein n=1 Tax=Chlamydomonas incerta TaxID=51695 RepID=A0A835SN48_CHLIN|nr:hypothetical protein HXX76_010232 [Chlamydomonas incerta]|eukprot:KAG2430133.1 hypothetical protein HXX76_010232 [Chlamydomonas incerta]